MLLYYHIRTIRSQEGGGFNPAPRRALRSRKVLQLNELGVQSREATGDWAVLLSATHLFSCSSFFVGRVEDSPAVRVHKIHDLIVHHVRLATARSDCTSGAVLQMVSHQLAADAAQSFVDR